MTQDTKFEALSNGTIDLATTRNSISMSAGDGFTHTIPYLYLGLEFVGVPQFVECADNDIDVFDACSSLSICVIHQSMFLEILKLRIPQSQLIVEGSYIEMFEAFDAGRCNVIATGSAYVAALAAKALGYNATEIAIGTREYTTEMWSLKTIDTDREFSNMVNAALMALLAAEEAGITQETAHLMAQTDIFGASHKDMNINAVRANGNFGELYDFPVPRGPQNQPNNGSTGLLLAHPFGRTMQQFSAPTPIDGGILEKVLNRGILHCGIRGDRPGFAVYMSDQAEWTGIDVEYCSTLAASLFNGKSENVVFLDVTDSGGGWSELEKRDVDVLAGTTWTLEDSVRGFKFSEPYFYGPLNSTFEDNLCLGTLQSDPQWSSFVYWTAQSLVFAEDQGITQRQSKEMPLAQSTGSNLQRMFRDAIHSAGNYREVYERHLEAILPRGGRNKLYRLEDQGPLRYLPPNRLVLR